MDDGIKISYKYRNQVANYEKDTKGTLIPKLEKIKEKYTELLDMIEDPKDGDYLTSHVKEELEKEIKSIESLISNINSRCIDLNKKAKELDDQLSYDLSKGKVGDSNA
jgi:hypothetical protein